MRDGLACSVGEARHRDWRGDELRVEDEQKGAIGIGRDRSKALRLFLCVCVCVLNQMLIEIYLFLTGGGRLLSN